MATNDSTIVIFMVFGKGNIPWNKGKCGVQEIREKVVIELELLWSLYWGNQYTLAKISSIFGCCHNTIKQKMEKYDIPRRTLQEASPRISRKLSEDAKKKISKLNTIYIIESELLESLYWGNYYSTNEISSIFNCSIRTITRFMENFGIERRDRSECHKVEKIIIEPELLYALYWGNEYNFREISELFDCSICTINSRFVKYNIPYLSLSESIIRSGTNVGENNPSWKNGISEILEGERKTLKYYRWRYKVRERYKNTCQECGNKENIHAHHIKPFADYPELRFDVDNGITLCRDCHINIHRSEWL